MNKIAIVLIAFLPFLTGCSKDTDNIPGNKSRDIRYEISGNFTGTLFASYTTASGGTTNEQVTSLPWNKEITYAPGVTAAIIAVSGNGGAAGQQVTVVVKQGGSQVSSTPVTANSSGSFTQATPVVTF